MTSVTHYLRVTDGTNTVNLIDGTNTKLSEYAPEVVTNMADPVQERLTVHLIGSLATNRSTINALNRLFEQARNYARSQTGKRVYINFDPGTGGTVYRAMLFDGAVLMNDDTLDMHYINEDFILEIEWTRWPFWEGPLTQIPLTNSSDTDNTDGITVDNVYDSVGENFVTIDSGDVIGDLPSPIKLEMYNADYLSEPIDEIYLFHNVYSTPASLDHVLEGEDATGAGVSVESEAYPESSDDEYADISWTATTETKIATWALSSAQLGYMAGGRFSVLARWNSVFPYSDCWLRLKVEGASGVLWEGEQNLVKDTRELHMIDTLRLPPYLEGQSNIKGVNLCLYAYRNQSGTHTIPLDYLMLGCISGDGGWKRFKSVDAGIDYQEYFYHDNTERFSYRVDGSSNKIAEFQEFGGPILLVPNADQRLYFLTCDNNGDARVDQGWTVKLWYRPRRSSI